MQAAQIAKEALKRNMSVNGNAGAAWVFTRSGSIWTQQGSKLVGTGAVGTPSQGVSVSLSADGRTLAPATPRATGAARLLPSALGDVIARWPALPEPQAAGTRVLVGSPLGPLVPLELGALAEWGAPTGIALVPDASGFVLGQRGPSGERILRVDLACAE